MKRVTMRAGILALAILLLAGCPPSLWAATTFSGTGNWNDTARWSGSAVPGPGEDVIVAGNVTLTNATASLNSYVLNAGNTHTIVGTNSILHAGAINIYGTVTHSNNTATATNTIGLWVADNIAWLVADADLTVHTNGQVNVDYKGYTGGPVYPASGRGPGGGMAERAGGSYGGVGGLGYGTAVPGPVYGAASEPPQPGSGGGSGGSGGVGGAGGGAVRLEAGGRVRVNGLITAQGVSILANTGGSGSGGGIFIRGGSFDGIGSINAAGGLAGGATAGGGGGGRVAIFYTNSAAQALLAPSVQFVLGGRMGKDYTLTDAIGRPGTIYLTDTNFWPVTTLAGGGLIMIPGFTNWSPASLTITNSSVQFPAGFVLSVAGNVAVTNAGELILSNVSFSCGGNLTVEKSSAALELRDHATLDCGGNLTISNTGLFYLYAGLTNGAASNYALRTSVTGSLIVATNSYIFPVSNPTNGGSALFAAGSLKVSSGGQISADGRGFAGGAKYTVGYGPGGGKSERAGGSYGGLGGIGFSSAAPGALYGVPEAPIDAGSGGGGDSTWSGRSGGGAVRVVVTAAAVIDGTISADGGTTGNGAGGSGGAIYISCGTVNGSGTIRARGGSTTSGGGGGGGRIALIYTNLAAQSVLSPVLQFDLKGGTGNSGASRRGTLVLADSSFFPKETLTGHYWLIIPGFANWAPNSLTITNGSLQCSPGFVYNVTQAVTIATNSALELRENNILNCGSLRVANGAELSIYAGATNLTPDYGCLVNVTGEMRVETNASVYPYSESTNGGSCLFRVGDLFVDAGGKIDSAGKGYATPTSPGRGWGSGAGSNSFGASYGGRGGFGGQGGTNGPAYGSSNAPVHAGSGGGMNTLAYYGGAGGGVVRVEATKSVRVDGTINANANPGYAEGGGGAGGSIYIRCKRFYGGPAGVLMAKGGDTGTGSTQGGSGAGGRIAVWRSLDAWQGTVSVTNGVAYATHLGQVGTIVWGLLPPPGTTFMMR